MPWIDDEQYDDKSLSSKGALTAAHVDLNEKRERCNNLGGLGKCFRCANAFIVTLKRRNDPIIKCEAQRDEPIMPLDVVECNKYREVGKLSLGEMAQLAKLVGEPEKRQAGFLGRYSITDNGSLPEGTEQESMP